MYMLLTKRLPLLLAAFCLLLTVVSAQSSTATLSGTVEDERSAVIPGAAVTVRNYATSLVRHATTNESGSFTIPLLPPGEYTVLVEREGFTRVQLTNIILNVGDQKAVSVQLKVGDVKSEVTVTADASLVRTDGSVGTVVDRTFVENTPLNGRSFQSLITLTPGVVLVPSNANSGFNGQFSVNGQRANANYFTVDGVSANTSDGAGVEPGQSTSGTLPGLTTLGTTSSLVSVDSLEEFKVQTSSFSAEFGRTPGGQISLVTRAGSNEVRGTLFEYFRNEKLDANDWFANRGRNPRAPLRQNLFGGTFSGPVVLPKFGEGDSKWYNGRNRTFFFFSYEGLRQRTPAFALTNVPTLALRQTAPVAIRPILNSFPLPNGRDLGNGLAEFSNSFSNSGLYDATAIRIDHAINSRLSVFGRYSRTYSRNENRTANNLSNINFRDSDSQTFTFAAVMAIRSTVNNDLRANYTANRGIFGLELDEFGGAVPLSRDLVILPQFVPSAATPTSALVQLGFPGLTALEPPRVSINQSGSSQRQLNIVDTLAVTSGSHQLKVGVDYRRLTPLYEPRVYSISVIFSSQTNVLNATAPTGFVNASREAKPVYTNFSAFVQDNWNVSQRLNLNFGLRWDLNPPPTAADGNTPYTVRGLDNLATLELAPQGTPLWETTYNNFAPRFGIAYQISQAPGRETVLRAGGGVFYDSGNSQASAGFNAFPFNPNRTVPNISFPLSPVQVAPPVFTLNPPYGRIRTFEPGLKLPYTLQWNISLEQSLGRSQTVSASYVASAGRRLLRQHRLNLRTINPRFTDVDLTTDDATSDYHSMQLQFQRRLSRNLQALASYTWAHAIDDVSTDALSNVILRGNSDFDVRHVFAAAVSYNFHVPKGNRVTDTLFSDWSLDLRMNAQTALPLNIIAGTFFDVDGTEVARRATLVSGVPVYLDDANSPGGRRINRNAFATPPAGRSGNLGRNIIRGLPAWQVDLALRRAFKVSERLNLQFRAEAFNVFNHPNFGAIQTNLTTPAPPTGNFGEATNMLGRQLSGLNVLYQIGGPRSVQFALRVQF